MTVGAFQTPRPHAGPKMMTLARIVTLGGPIPVTAGTIETRRKHEKVTTVTRMAASRIPISVTVGTFERFGLGGGDHTMGGMGGVGSPGPR